MSNLEYYLLEKEGENSKCGILDLGKCMDSDENSTGETVFTTSTNVEVPSSFTDNGNCHEEEIEKDDESISSTDLKLGEQTQVVETSGDQILRFISTEESCPEVSEDRDMEVEKDMGTCESADSVLKDIIDMNVEVGIREDSRPSVDGNSEIADTNGEGDELNDANEEGDELAETLPCMGKSSPGTNTKEETTKANINEMDDSDSKATSINDIIDDFCNKNTEILTTKESSFSVASDTDDKDLPVVDESNLEVEDGEMDIGKGMELEAKKFDREDNTKESKENESEEMEQDMEVEEKEMETEEKDNDDEVEKEREMKTVEQEAEDKEQERKMETVEQDENDKIEEWEVETEEQYTDDKEVEEREMETVEQDADDDELEEREEETVEQDIKDKQVEEKEMETVEQDADNKEMHAVHVKKDLEDRKKDLESKEFNVKEKDDLKDKENNLLDKDINLQDSQNYHMNKDTYPGNRRILKRKPKVLASEEEDSEDLDDNLEEILEDEEQILEDEEQILEDEEQILEDEEQIHEDEEHSDGKTFEDKMDDSEDLDNNLEENLEEIFEDDHSDGKNLKNKEEQVIDNEKNLEKQIESTVIEDNTDNQSDEEPQEKFSNGLKNAEDSETFAKSENIDMEYQDQEVNKLSEKLSKEKNTLINVKESVGKEKSTNKWNHLKESEQLSTEQEEIFERSNVKSIGKINKLQQQKAEKKADVSAHTSTAIVNNAKDHIIVKGVQENENDPYIDFDEESIENISKTIKSFSSENVAFKKHEKRTGSNQKTDSTQTKRVIMVKTASNVERVKRKLEEILEKSKGEEDAAIAELQRMKKEKTDILNAITTEMEKLKSMLVKDKQ